MQTEISLDGLSPPTVGDLKIHTHILRRDALGRDVKQLFDETPDCPGILLPSFRGLSLGLLSRQRFKDLLLQPYGQDLYLNRPVARVVDWRPLVIDRRLTLDLATHRALARGPKGLAEPIVIRLDEGAMGVLDMQVLMEALVQDLAEKNRITGELLKRIQGYADQVSAAFDEAKRANAELEQFAYMASHDLREPLRTVNSYLRLLERRFKHELGEEGQAFIEFAVDGTRRMDAMIRGLLDFSRIGRHGPATTVVALEEVVQEALRNLEAAIADTRATVRTSPGLPSVWGERLELVSLFQNLIGNAIKYRSPDRRPEIQVEWSETASHWQVAVGDNGTGIPARYQERIFQLFQRLVGQQEVEGTGIGLAVCRKIAEHHGGTIRVESEEGRGSTFLVSLAKGGG